MRLPSLESEVFVRAKFTRDTIPFLTKAGKQKNPNWLDKHQDEFERVVKTPFVQLARTLKERLLPVARGYHFPTQGIGRIKRPPHKVLGGESQYKDWLSITMARPTGNRFLRNPHLFFGILSNHPNWNAIVVSGGLYLPGSEQIKNVRRAIERDASPFHDIFDDPAFRARFKTGFAPDLKSTRVPRDFDPDHADVEWLKLKQFYVVKKIPRSIFLSGKLDDNLIADYTQLLRLNTVLERALSR